MNINKKKNKGGQHQMNEQKMRFNPYYKYRKLDNKELISFRMPNDIKEDIEQYFRDNNQSKTDGFNQLIYDFLNSHCFERKKFSFGMFLMMKKDHDLNPDDFICLGIQDGYNTSKRLNETHNVDSIWNSDMELHGNSYVDYEMIRPNDLKDNLFDNKERINILFEHFQINYALFDTTKDYHECNTPSKFVSYVESKYDVDMDETFYVNLTLNNYLDVKSDGLYKCELGEKNEDHHKGIGIIVDADGKQYYITYEWHLMFDSPFNPVMIENFDFHETDEFAAIIHKSSNKKLQNYFKYESDFKVYISNDEILENIRMIDENIARLKSAKKEYEDLLK